MSQTEINKDLEEKKNIFLWLIKNKIRDLDSIGKVMNIYYTNRNKLNEIIKKNDVKAITNKEKAVGPDK